MDYTATITTSAPPEQAARQIADDLELWWSTRVDRGRSGFTIRFNTSHATFAIDPGSTARDQPTCGIRYHVNPSARLKSGARNKMRIFGLKMCTLPKPA
ncbi:hypothetical protein [uncultured Tateyamaria sp.]|uniref:hypothetical protein n=1 Tax=uncultured Tateyamaria sp. TaxID=455651 RepID=UPI0026029FDC|nr:hypothetical protein [uncultured Tateyamaria sp.]